MLTFYQQAGRGPPTDSHSCLNLFPVIQNVDTCFRRKDRESMSTSPSTAQLHTSASSTSGVSGSRSFLGTAGPYIQNNLAGREEEEGLQGAVGGCDIIYDDGKCKSVHFGDICKRDSIS